MMAKVKRLSLVNTFYISEECNEVHKPYSKFSLNWAPVFEWCVLLPHLHLLVQHAVVMSTVRHVVIFYNT